MSDSEETESSSPADPDSWERIEALLSAHPHDGFFQAVFGKPERAALFLRTHLPREAARLIDWSSLAVESASFVKSSLHRRHGDLLFSARSNTGHGVLFQIVFEHQSTVDGTMPLRLLAYMVEIWAQWSERWPKEPLPVIVPLVLHQGPDHWTVSPRFVDLLELPVEMESPFRQYIPQFTHGLWDLTRSDPARDEEHPELQTALLLMKLARLKDEMANFLRWLAEQLAPLADDLLRLCLLYALHSERELDLDMIADILRGNPALKDNAMSLAQRIRAEGKTEGKAEGVWMGKIQLMERFLGMEETPEEEMQELTLEALELRFKGLQQSYDQRFKQG